MKTLSTCIVALVFAAGSSVALGGPGHGDGHRDRHAKGDKHHKSDRYYRAGPLQNVRRIEHAKHHREHHREHAREHRRHKAVKEHRRQHRKYRKHHWNHHYGHRYDRHAWRYNRWHHQPWRYNHYRWNRPHYGDYLGAALLGSALTYSFYHTHNGAVCYDRHDDRNDVHYREGGYSDIVGCHRIERLSDGSEVRVDVPLSQCR